MKLIRKILAFLWNWNELISLPLAMVLWYFSADLIRIVDVTAAAYDGGVFQIYLFAFIGLLIANFVTWIMLKINFPGIYHYLDNFLEQNLKNRVTASGIEPLTTWEKSKIALFLFALYFLGFVLLARVL